VNYLLSESLLLSLGSLIEFFKDIMLLAFSENGKSLVYISCLLNHV
jgi:hypothetical protein